MTTFCCESCIHEPSCVELLEAAFARPDDITDPPNIVRGEE